MGLVLLDLDGTVRRSKSGATFINDPEDQELIPGVMDAMQAVSNAGHNMIAITNQRGVAAGHKSLEECICEQQITLSLTTHQNKHLLDAIVLCPDNGETAWLVWYENNSIEDYISYFGTSLLPPSEDMMGLDWPEIITHEWAELTQGQNFRKPDTGMAHVATLFWSQNRPANERDEFPLLMVGDMGSDRLMAETYSIPYRDAADWLGNPLP